LRDQRGNTAMIFGLAVIPLLALGGGAVDFAQRARVRGELQSAADTAALAASRMVQSGQMARDTDWEALKAKAEASATKFLLASIKVLGTHGTPDFNVDVTDEGVTIDAHYDMKTSFLGVIGMNTLPANALAEVHLPEPILVEMAMVLDFSGSMVTNDKFIRMRNAAMSFINKVKQDRADRTKIGIVPFSKYVYASVPGAMIRGTNAGQAATMMNACLTNRDYPYSTTDQTPSSTIDPSRWPQVDPADPDCQAYAAKDLRVRDLTDDFPGLVSAIAGMQPQNLTNISLGTEIGWQLLSPNAPFETARDYSDGNLQKIMIVLTDGMQTVAAEGPDGTTSVAAANQTTAELCTNIKATGIRVFTIAYDVDDTAVYSLLSGCASSPGDYHEVHDASDIGEVFDDIYAQINESAWLSK
jgi:Flp pilus assembly protein TadG